MERILSEGVGEVLANKIKEKQDKLTEGTNISIQKVGNNTVISSTGGSSASTLHITTQEASLEGKTVTATNGTDTFTGTISNGVCDIQADMFGAVQISASDGSETARISIDMNYVGYYNVNLTFKWVKVAVSTSDSMLFGQKATLYEGNSEIASAVIDGTGAAEMTINTLGNYTVKASGGGFKASQDVNVNQFFQTFNVALSLDYATITITTQEATLYGKGITITDSNDNVIATSVFSNSGSATVYTDQYGTFTVTATDGTDTAIASVTTASGQSATAVLRFEYATIHVTTSDPLLDGATVTVKKGSTVVKTGTFSNGVVDFTVNEIANFTIETGAEGFTTSGSANVAAFFQT